MQASICQRAFICRKVLVCRGSHLVKSGGPWLASDLSKAQFLKNSTWILHLNDDKTPPTACNSSEAVRYYSHTGNDQHSWWLSNSTSWSVGLSFQGATMDSNQSAPLTARCCAGVIDFE